MNLSNKYIFISIIIFCIGILTFINNYYFYAHVFRSSSRDASQLELIIKSTISSCQKNNIDKKLCENMVIDITKIFSTKDYYNKSTIVKNENGDILWEKKPFKRDFTAYSKIEITLNSTKDFLELQYITILIFNKIELLKSVWNSMTLSFIEFFEITYERGMKEAIDAFKTIYWYRSRPFIGYAIFTFILFYIYRNKQKKDNEKKNELEQKLLATFQQNEVLAVQKQSLEENYQSICKKIKDFDYLINPPLDVLKIDTLFSDLDSFGNKCRKVAEKIIFDINNHLKLKPIDLYEGINNLYSRNLISENTKKYLTIIRLYGNLASHYNEKNITREEAITVALCLISVVEEISQIYSLTSVDNVIQKNNIDKKESPFFQKNTGLKIIRKGRVS